MQNDHYFSQSPAAARRPRTLDVQIQGLSLRFHTDAGVFSKSGLDAGTSLLIKHAPPLSGRAADMGCGWGALGIPLALLNPSCEIHMGDVNHRAVDLCAQNIAENKAHNASVRLSDGMEGFEGQFQTVLSNPPIRAGKQVIYRMFAQAHERLAPGGALLIVIRKQQGANSALAELKGRFARAEMIARESGYWIIRADKEG